MINNRIIISKKDFYKISPKIKSNNIIFNKEKVILILSKKYLSILKENEINYYIINKRKIKIGFILGYLYLIISILINNIFISEIEFNNNYLINNNIKEEISKDLKDFLIFKIYKGDLKELNKKLRLKYITYEYIYIYKKGSKIKVDINKKETYTNNNNEDIPGDLVAIKDAYIYKYEIYKGKPLIKYNDYVKKGDILVSGKLFEESNNYYESRGIVLGVYQEEINIKIKIKNIYNEYTGNIKTYKTIDFFNKHKIKNPYQESEIIESNIINFFNIIKYKKIQIKEKNDIIYIYNEEEALNKAKSEIEKEFLLNKQNNEEKILSYDKIEINYDNDYFYFTFLVKKIENIAIFKEMIN